MNTINVLLAMIIALGVGKIFSKFKMPAILGWLITGMVLGPHAINLLNEGIMVDKSYTSIISIFECVVGLMIGSELVIKKLKKSGKEIIITTLFQSLGTFVFVSACFYFVFIMMDIPTYLAFIFGAIALATAPAPALSIIQEFKTKGPVTDTLVPMAALDDIVGMVVFFTVISMVGSSGASQSLVMNLLLMIGAPCIIGLVFGIGTGKVMNRFDSKKETLVILIVSILLVSLFGMWLNTTIFKASIINFMLLGMAYSAGFANMLSEQKLDKVMKVAEPLIAIAIILVILNLGAPLNYHLIVGAGTLTFIYIVSRMIGKYFGARIGASVMKMPDTVKKYLGFTLLPHSGVSLVFTGIAVTTLLPTAPELATIIQATIAAAAIINEVIAVIISKKAFEWAGEIQTKHAN